MVYEITILIFVFKKKAIMDFFQLIREGKLESIKTMVELDKNIIHQRNERGFTPLILAGYSNNLDLTLYFLSQGADINEVDVAGNTALMGVCFKGNLDIAKALIASNAKLNVVNFSGATALIYATMFGQTEIVRVLLNSGADKTIKDANSINDLKSLIHE